ncbi:MAG: 16S rRNA (guanine(966)-N(2))-methyltransferase RsmD [Nitrospirota bacterium]|nr:16S rRNA (guanine(966)-N(2))-methyltransferase RsmD [Nitrospirota bacterium]
MRISGGIAKGRQIVTKKYFSKASDEEQLRPTSSKVREALFDIIRNEIDGASFVDLYAGTGTVGFEALSRGASRAIFVEPNDLRAITIKKNADEFGFREKAQVVKSRAHEFLEKSSSKKESFDIFFVDPPYHSEEIKKVLPMIGEKGLLNKSGVVIVEHFFKREMPETAGELKIDRSYRYGDTMLTFYRKSVNK